MIHKKYEIRLYGDGNLSGMLTQLKSAGANITFLYVDGNSAYFYTDRKGLALVRRYRKRHRMKVSISQRDENSSVGAFLTSYRYLVLFMIPLVASFFLWTVDVESDIPEVVERIEEKLVGSSIVPLRPLMLIPDEGEIRRLLMQDDPSLSWVRFKRTGATLTVIPMLSPASEIREKEQGPPADLVARTGGVITRFELVRGERVAHVHKTAKKGELLATGILEQGDKTTIVGAEGAVYADYWMEYAFDLPKIIRYKIQGEEKVDFAFTPPWNDVNEQTANPVGWKGFFSRFVRVERYMTEVEEILEIEEGMEQSILVPLVKQKLLSERDATLLIKEEKVLHVTFDNDRVNGTILFLVNDNIAIKRTISQGD
ncbi:sporulation protein YqfD [Sporosarcina sp. CAU 1771]